MGRRKKPGKTEEVRVILQEHSPEAAQILCEMLSDDSLSGTTRVSVAKEILERAVGKGQLQEPERANAAKFQLVLKVVE
jgi:hypothetical protein